jgi:hypothetical protein
MYKFEISEEVIKKIKSAKTISPSVVTKLDGLATSPLKEAIKTNIPLIGNYYTNCGRWCLLFNVNEKEETVQILQIVLSPYLHKIITGRLTSYSAN